MSATTTAEKYKSQGNELFKKGDYVGAIGSYTRAIQTDAQNPVLPLNRAMAYIKLHKYDDAERDCTAALALQPSNAKASYRRGLARKGKQNYVSALTDFQDAQQLDPTNSSIQSEIMEVQRLLEEAKHAAKARAAKKASLRARPSAPVSPATPVPKAAPDQAAVQAPSDPALMQEVSTRRFEPSGRSAFTAAKEMRQAKEAKQRSALGMPRSPVFPSAPNATTASIATTSSPPIDRSSVSKPPAPMGAPPTFQIPLQPNSYDFLRMWTELFELQRRSDDWRSAWSLLSSIDAPNYASMFQDNLEPELVSQMLHVMIKASADDEERAQRACAILEEVSKSSRFDFVAMLLEDSEREVARVIFRRGGWDPGTMTWQRWHL